jgi:CheY-like chemotaxis protein
MEFGKGATSVPNSVEVLLIEDNATDIALIREALAGDSIPVTLHVAKDAEHAIQMLATRQFQPDLVILDLNLPKVSGLSFLERYHPHVPVVVFSSSTNQADIQRSFQLGAKDFVPKPSDLDLYKRVVSYIVRRWGAKDSGAEFAG